MHNKFQNSELYLRVLSSIIMIVLSTLLLVLGGILFEISLLFLAAILAWEILGFDDNKNKLKILNASLFAFSFEEPGAAAKLLKTYAKNFDNLEVKALVVEGQLLDGAQIDILAKLPSREEALGLVASVLQAPVGKFATLLNEVPSKLARALTAVNDKKKATA